MWYGLLDRVVKGQLLPGLHSVGQVAREEVGHVTLKSPVGAPLPVALPNFPALREVSKHPGIPASLAKSSAPILARPRPMVTWQQSGVPDSL